MAENSQNDCIYTVTTHLFAKKKKNCKFQVKRVFCLRFATILNFIDRCCQFKSRKRDREREVDRKKEGNRVRERQREKKDRNKDNRGGGRKQGRGRSKERERDQGERNIERKRGRVGSNNRKTLKHVP